MKKLLISIVFIIALCISAFAADTIYVSSNGNDDAAGTVEAPLGTLHAAFHALPYGGKIVLMNKLELDSIEFPKSEGLITITSNDGTTNYRAKGAKLILKKSIYIKSAVSFENINFEVTDSGIGIILGGNYTRFGEGINIIKPSADIEYPSVVVGTQSTISSDGGYLEIHSGTFSRIYCGAAGTSSAAQSGNATTAIYGGDFKGAIYMAGMTELLGTSNVYIYGGNFDSGIVGAAIANVSGDINLTIYGGTFSENAYLRPATQGIFSGNCTLNIFSGNIKNIWNVDSGAVTGELNVNVANGITLTNNPFSSATNVFSGDDIKKTTASNDSELAAAEAEKLPANVTNPLTSRENKYKGIANKATVLKKAVAGGDMDGDGIVKLIDVLKAFKSACGKYAGDADINEDKTVSVLDCMLILSAALDSQMPITEYNVSNTISRLIRYGNAVVTDNTFDNGYVFGSSTETCYTVFSKVKFNENGIVGIYFGCNSTTPASIQSGYYFEANTKNETLKVFRIENAIYRVIAERKLQLLSNEAEIKVTYGKTAGNAVQLYLNDNPLITDYYFDFDLILEAKGNGIGVYAENATVTTPVVIAETPSSSSDTYTNHILPSFTDPEIYFENGVYYIYGTANNTDGVQCYTTTDFITLNPLGTVLSIADSFNGTAITAANIVKADGIYYMFYLQGTTGYATSTSASGPFVTEEKAPLVSNTDIIGGQPFVDDDGTVYLIYTRTSGGNKTYISKVNIANGEAELDLSTEAQLLSPTEEWECAKAAVVECGFIVKHEGTYYLIYAGGNYNSTYGVGYATSDNIYGPYTKYENNPIMWSNDQAFGNGAASVFVSPDASEHFIIYLRNNGHTVTRPLNTCIDRIRFVPNPSGNLDILEIEGASVSPMPIPSGVGSNIDFDYQTARWHW